MIFIRVSSPRRVPLTWDTARFPGAGTDGVIWPRENTRSQTTVNKWQAPKLMGLKSWIALKFFGGWWPPILWHTGKATHWKCHIRCLSNFLNPQATTQATSCQFLDTTKKRFNKNNEIPPLLSKSLIVFKSWTLFFKGSGKYMGVSKYRGTPKWMVYNGKPD